jgi:hypothetical protein
LQTFGPQWWPLLLPICKWLLVSCDSFYLFSTPWCIWVASIRFGGPWL